MIELTATNLEKETRMVCLGLGIRIEDDDYRELKKAQNYKSGRGRRAAMQTIGLIQKGTKWQVGGMSAKDGKVWWCSNCNYKNAPRWRCSMCGHRNSEMATEATPAVYSNRIHTEPSAERLALNSMQTIVSAAKARADAARKTAEEEQAVLQAEAQAAAAEEEARNRDAVVAAEREALARQEWVAKAAERSALAVADAARKEEERRKVLADRVRQVMEEDLEINRERRKKQLQRLETRMVMRVGSIGDNDAIVAATAPQLGKASAQTGASIPLDKTAGVELTREMSNSDAPNDVKLAGTSPGGMVVPFLMAQLDEIAELSTQARGYEAEARKAQAAQAMNAGNDNRHQFVLADVHDPLGLQLATIRKLQQRSRPAGTVAREQQCQTEQRQDTPNDVRFMRSTLSLEPLVQQIEAHARRRSSASNRPAKGRLVPPTQATSRSKTGLEPYSQMSNENRRLLQKRSRRYGHMHTNYDMHDRQGATMRMTV